MRKIQFTPNAFQEYLEWRAENEDTFDRINDLIKHILRDPFKGIGKPEPLKGNWRGCWSRRITQEHRLIYEVSNDAITIHKCQGHYA